MQGHRRGTKLNPSSVNLGQEILVINGNKINNPFFQRLIFGNGYALPDSLFSPLYISVSFFRNGPDKCGCVIRPFLIHNGIGSGLEPDWMCRTYISAGRHHRNVGGHGNKNARGPGMGAGRRNIHDHRDLGLQYTADNNPGRLNQSAGSIKMDEQTGCVLMGCFFYAFLDIFGYNRVDSAIDL